MKNFREAVKRKMEKEGWMVDAVFPNNLITYRCERNKQVKLICAWQNGHGHIYRDTFKGLKRIEKEAGVSVLIAKVNGANEIIFLRLEKFSNLQKEEKRGPLFGLAQLCDMGFVGYSNGEFKKGERKMKTIEDELKAKALSELNNI